MTKKSVASINKYKKYINKLTSTIRVAERNFYHEKFSLLAILARLGMELKALSIKITLRILLMKLKMTTPQ